MEEFLFLNKNGSNIKVLRKLLKTIYKKQNKGFTACIYSFSKYEIGNYEPPKYFIFKDKTEDIIINKINEINKHPLLNFLKYKIKNKRDNFIKAECYKIIYNYL